jgi:hypothetical protein
MAGLIERRGTIIHSALRASRGRFASALPSTRLFAGDRAVIKRLEEKQVAGGGDLLAFVPMKGTGQGGSCRRAWPGRRPRQERQIQVAQLNYLDRRILAAVTLSVMVDIRTTHPQRHILLDLASFSFDDLLRVLMTTWQRRDGR